MTYELIKEQTKTVVEELLKKAKLKAGDILVVGCSSSEIRGSHIGKNSDIDAAKAVYDSIKESTENKGIYIAAQCCEHLNRAIVTEREALPLGTQIVNAVPTIHAGGSFATTLYKNAKRPVLVETIEADAGIDIGSTLIGMHLKAVAVPVRVSINTIGHAHVVCARTRPKFIGGSRAVYDDKLSGGDIER